MKLNFSSLLQFAESAMKKKQWYIAVQNLNDAFDLCADEDRHKLYLAYADLFLAVGNQAFARYALFMAAKTEYKGGYYCLDFSRFLPEQTGIVVDEEADEEENISAENILMYNNIYRLIAIRKYADALKLFFTVSFNRRNMASIVDALATALSVDEKFDLDSYLVPLLPIIGEYASGDAEFVNLLLTGGDNTRLLAVEGVKYFVEDNEDVDLLRDMGEVYFLASEFDCAALFFEKVLSLCEIDEMSLYYMYVISTIKKDAVAEQKYRARFFAVCRFAMPPMALVDACAQTARAKSVCEYLSYTEMQMMSQFKKLQAIVPDDLDVEHFIAVKNFCCGANPYFASKLLQHLSTAKDKSIFYSLCIALTESAFVRRDTKAMVIKVLLNSGYEGTLSYSVPEKAVLCDAVKFRHRLGIWNDIFYHISSTIITSQIDLPYYPSLLESMIKKCRAALDDGLSQDNNFRSFLVAINYANCLQVNINISDYISLFSLTPEELEENLALHGMESPIL